MRITTMVMFILIGSTAFSLVFRGLGGDRFIDNLLINLSGVTTDFLLINMLVIFLLGFFINFLEIALIIILIFAPVAQQLGLDLVWYGVIVGANLQTSFLTLPFLFCSVLFARSGTTRTQNRRHLSWGNTVCSTTAISLNPNYYFSSDS